MFTAHSTYSTVILLKVDGLSVDTSQRLDRGGKASNIVIALFVNNQGSKQMCSCCHGIVMAAFGFSYSCFEPCLFTNTAMTMLVALPPLSSLWFVSILTGCLEAI